MTCFRLICCEKIHSRNGKDKECSLWELYQWDFKENLRTDKIDSLSISALEKSPFYDRGQGEKMSVSMM